MIRKMLLVCVLAALAGCSHWQTMSEREQQTVVIAGAILTAGVLIATQIPDTPDICISTRSLKTGCPR